jgi:hypothetical protein
MIVRRFTFFKEEMIKRRRKFQKIQICRNIGNIHISDALYQDFVVAYIYISGLYRTMLLLLFLVTAVSQEWMTKGEVVCFVFIIYTSI